MQTVVLGCSCNAEAGLIAVTGPSTARAMARAFFFPKASKRQCRASMIVPIPMVST